MKLTSHMLVYGAGVAWVELAETFSEVVKLAWEDDAIIVAEWNGDRYNDITGDMADQWFEANWTVQDGIEGIPPMFKSHLGSLAQDRMNAAFDPTGEMTRADEERGML